MHKTPMQHFYDFFRNADSVRDARSSSGSGRVSLPSALIAQLKPHFRWCYNHQSGVWWFLSWGNFKKSLMAISEFWCISGKKIITYDCNSLWGKTGVCPIIETVVFLGRQNIPLRGHRDGGLLRSHGPLASFVLYPPLAGTSYVQQPTHKFRSRYDYLLYEDMKGNEKCRNFGRFGQLGVTQGHLQCRLSTEHIQLLIDFIRA